MLHGDEKQRLDETRLIGGSYFYMSPEMADAKQYRSVLKSPDSHKYWNPMAADVWASGITLFGSLTGNIPWKKAVVTDRDYRAFTREKSSYFDEYIKSGDLDEQELMMLMKMLDTNPDHRITAAEILKDSWFTGLKDSCSPFVISQVLPQ